MLKPKADFLIEVSYEVVNALGGVYTVQATKAKEIEKYYGDNYYIVGPYYKSSAAIEFEEHQPPPEIKQVFQQLEKEGIVCHYGTWLIEGRPKTFLVDFSGRLNNIKQIRDMMSRKYEIDLNMLKSSPKQIKIGDNVTDLMDLDLLLVWGESTAMLIKKLLKLDMFKNKMGVLQCHSDAGKPIYSLIKDLKEENSNTGLVITFHSTRLGRAIATNKEDLYTEVEENLKKHKKIGKRREYKYGGSVIPSHQLALLGVRYADIVTVVSEVTKKEVEYILGRRPDIITPNAINIEKYPTIEERAVLHGKSKEKLRRFLEAYFLPYYPSDVKNSLLLFISGRYEFHTKGFDVFIQSLGKLNQLLKKEDYSKNIFVFFLIRDKKRKRENYEVLENLSRYEQIEDYIYEKFPDVERKVISMLVHGDEVSNQKLIDSDFLMETKKLMARFKRHDHKNPPICALEVDEGDTVYNTLKDNGLLNRSEDKVKVVYYPKAVSIGDGLLSMNYYEAVAGMHLGVFPSYYEPWGYTPLETAAYSVLSITTDLAGFGRFVKKNTDQRKKPGVLVLRREGRTNEQVVDDLTDMLHWFSKLPRITRVKKKLDAKNISDLVDWKEFSKYYIQAHNMAVERCAKRIKRKIKSSSHPMGK